MDRATERERVDERRPRSLRRGTLSICTWLYAETTAEESSYPQVPGRASTSQFQAVYWRCVAVFFATSYRHQPDARHVLFTNVEHLPVVDGVDVEELLDRLGVELVRLPLTHVTPPGHFHAWRNQFYVLDMVAHLAAELGEDDAAVILDSDSVWIGGAGPIHEAIERDGVLAYVENYDVDWSANGLTRREMQVLSSELLGEEVASPLVYCGGEFIAGSGAELKRITTELELAWTTLLTRHASGATVFNEEAQMLSFVYYKLGYPVGNGDPFVRRIWTGSLGGFDTALPHDLGLVVWHLPLEKRFGIRRLFPAAADPSSWLWTTELGDPWRRTLGRALGVPRSPVGKKLRDLGQRVRDKVRHR